MADLTPSADVWSFLQAANNAAAITSLGAATAAQGALAATALQTNSALGTPASGVLTNCTGLPVSTGVSGLGSGVATYLATPTLASLLAATSGLAVLTGNAFTGANTTTLALTTTPTEALSLINSNAATSGNQKVSPSLCWRGNGYGTTGSASQTVDFKAYVLPVQGTNPTGSWVLQKSINGAAFSNVLTIDSSGSGAFVGALSAGGTIGAPGITNSGQLIWTAVNNVAMSSPIASTVHLGLSTTASQFRVNNTYSSTTSYEGFKMDWTVTANVCRIGTSKGSGGGSARALQIEVGDTPVIKLGTAGEIGFYNVSPVARASAITAPSGGAIVDTESRTAISSIITALQNIGITA